MWNRNFNPSPSRRALQSHNTLLDFPRARAVAAIDIGACEDWKNGIRDTVQDGRWNSSAREQISELQTLLELNAGELDYRQILGLWRLIYTTAPDVVPLMLDEKVSAPRLPWQPRVSAIYQRFTSVDEGIVQNIVQFGDGVFFDRQKGATFVVNASWFKSAERDRTIELTFESAQFCSLTPTSGFEAFLAPPFLPRSTLQHQLLLGLAEFDVRIPLPTASNLSRTSSRVTGKYNLTYCDQSMLIGRAQVGGGVFIFERADVSALW